MSELEALKTRVAALEGLLQRLCNVPMVAMALGAHTTIRAAVASAEPAPPRSESRHATSIHPSDQAIKDGLKLKILGAELGK